MGPFLEYAKAQVEYEHLPNLIYIPRFYRRIHQSRSNYCTKKIPAASSGDNGRNRVKRRIGQLPGLMGRYSCKPRSLSACTQRLRYRTVLSVDANRRGNLDPQLRHVGTRLGAHERPMLRALAAIHHLVRNQLNRDIQQCTAYRAGTHCFNTWNLAHGNSASPLCRPQPASMPLPLSAANERVHNLERPHYNAFCTNNEHVQIEK